ncbi:Gfo/Idh/MocA family oxidoreductase [Janibacter cremeus]|uniref:Gfo/Idh/MocA family protein n=1 Tax=Janibacter cremeus TaxID=1285192 RepID=UPI0023F65B0F|nr:Gfo/Idh/MocA family oxidoreductase [Janibacter cremeus]WEV76951.1 Gfo/Idh/MocA family oxidoreductase [Janibacter cremeus]
MMKIGVVGCGYVFDHYMATLDRHPDLEIGGIADRDAVRLKRATGFYGLPAYPSVAALLDDPSISIIANFTSIESHYLVTKAALQAGKHVYSEKPLTTDLAQAEELMRLADEAGLHLSCAPSNALSDTSLTMWKAVVDGAVGDVRMVYAEFDDNPIYLMSPDGWRSRSGAPWPYLHEYEMGCTWEHIGYHLAWMCSIFGPVRSVTAFSKVTVPDKTDQPLDPADTPDFSVACLDFESGVVGRVTCSIAAPYDHRMRIIGNKGMIHANTYRHYECPVYLEPFTKLSLNARKSRSVRTKSWVQAPFGVGGRRVPLASASDGDAPGSRGWKGRWRPRGALQRWKRRELGQQDKMVGIAELADAVRSGRTPFPGPDFIVHLTELTLAVQRAGPDGASQTLKSRFTPVELPAKVTQTAPDYTRYAQPGPMARHAGALLDRMHQH